MVSVCMATFNGSVFILDQVRSILSQLSDTDELVISDDSSTDNTLDLIKAIGDARIILIEKKTFRNPVLNFENALRNARGEIILLSDQDDIWLENKIDTLKNHLTQCDLVTTDCKIVSHELRILSESYLSLVNGKTGFIRNLLKTSPYMGCCMGFNRKVLERSLPFPPSIPMHDFWIAMVAEAFYQPRIIYEPFVLHRRHDQNTSSTGQKSKNSFLNKLLLRKNILIPLLKLAWRNR
jgi:glycosyltransferase involved in cell wall biosynthesis